MAETRLGWTGVALDEAGAIRRATLFRDDRETVLRELACDAASDCEHPRSREVVSALERYTAGDRTALEDFPVNLEAHPDLQSRAWLALRTIPAGETRSYGWLAEKLGQSRGSARAIGAMMGDNPIPLWLPCHRIIASDGTLGGFGGGLAMKVQLLELEGALPQRML